MRFKTTVENLKKAVIKASGTLPVKTISEALNNYLIIAEKGEVTITANNLTTAIITRCPAEITEEGKALVDGKRFTDLIKSFSDGNMELDISLDIKENSLNIKYGKSKTKFASLNPAEYPALPQIEKWDSQTALKQEDLRKAILNTVFVISDTNPNAVLNGVNFSLYNSRLSIISLSSASVAVRHMEVPIATDVAYNFTIPLSSAGELRKALTDKDDTDILLEESKSAGYVKITLKDSVFIIRTLAGEYPYKMVNQISSLPSTIPEKMEVKFDRKMLLEIINRSLLLTDKMFNEALIISTVGTDLRLQRQSNFGNLDEYIEVEKTYGGTALTDETKKKEIKKGINPVNLRDVLSNITDDTVSIVTGIEANVPYILQSEDYFYAIMPVNMRKE